MRSTVNAKIGRIATALTVLVVLAYGAYLKWDSDAAVSWWQRKYINAHRASLAGHPPLEGIVLGGSNSVYGYSARQLEQTTGMHWHNYSLFLEGYSRAAYNAFIDDVSHQLDRDRVKVVVYSSVRLLSAPQLQRYDQSHRSLDGRPPLSLKPAKSVAGSVYDPEPVHAPNAADEPPPDEFGDLDFDHVVCRQELVTASTMQIGDTELAALHVRRVTRLLRQDFPNAIIVITVPNISPPGSEAAAVHDRFVEHLQTLLSPVLAGPGVQPATAGSTPDDGRPDVLMPTGHVPTEYACDSLNHMNREGRRIRTAELATQVQQALAARGGPARGMIRSRPVND